ncbi:MAG: 5'-methylthioadenosine/S-adenosylhomocysteine nucleosidase [Clostridia bacterium]|nr:5'-methylthioadenosine/S-adenosylhomocysteine nucleosidase [Clostridia bacterium]
MDDMLKIGVVVADKDEFQPFEQAVAKYNAEDIEFFNKKAIEFMFDGAKVYAVHCGIGKVNAAAAAVRLVDMGCNCILNYGLSGGISRVKKGQLCIPHRFLEHDFDLTAIGYKPCEKPGQKYIYNADKELLDVVTDIFQNVSFGTAVCGDRFICNDADRKFLKETFDATSCDMETGAIASVCDMAGIAFLSLRRISDDAGDDAASSYKEMNTCNELLSDCLIKILSAVTEYYGGLL